jgi:glycosyltransferase involved in cell wall biosynthesis
VRVSCLMVTLPVPERLAPMRRAIEAYLQQTHADRELVIVVDQGTPTDRAAVASTVAAFDRPDIVMVLTEAPMTLGALRNLSVAHASGDAICQWDDDDLHHPSRIAEQLAAPAQGICVATLLQDVILYRSADRTLFWTNWAATPATGHPGTLLCLRDAMPRYPEAGLRAHLNQDLILWEVLQAKRQVRTVPDRPHLYVYVVHGTNLSPHDHLEMLRRDLAISRGLLKRREMMLRAGLQPFPLNGVRVEGSNGMAFTL